MSENPSTTRVAVRHRYGSPDVVELIEVERPTPDDHQILVRVRAASLNRGDWYALTGTPRIVRPKMGTRPKNPSLGGDYAGIVEQIGNSVSEFRTGDDVFGIRTGALAEHLVARSDGNLAVMPEGAGFEDAAAVPSAALTALQGLRDKGGLQPGQSVLINGASGGVGTFAVQIAKALGAEVTAVCGPRGVDIARSLGADRVIDYTTTDFTRSGQRFDVLLDIAGTRSFRATRRVLAPGGIHVVIGGPMGGLLGPLGHVIRVRLGGMITRRRTVFFIASLVRADMETLRDMMADGRIRSVIDSRYPFEDVAEAFRHLGEGHPQGKIVVTM